MTIVALHHTDKDMFAIADGLISRGDRRVIAEDQKIVLFTPRYKIPQVRLGHFDGFSEYAGGSYGLAYAGNYTIVSTIVKRFTDIVNRLLVIDRESAEGGKPTIYQRDNAHDYFRSCSYDDTYNFDRDELLPITVNFLMNILQRVSTKACTDFAANAMERPDAHFAIFGADKIGHDSMNRCQILKCLNAAHGTLVFERFSALPWHLNCIGDASVIPRLITTIESTSQYAIPPVVPPSKPTDYELFDGEESTAFSAWIRKDSIDANWRKMREAVIEQEVLRLIAQQVGTIGGDCTIARSSWMSRLATQTISHSTISARFPHE